MKYKVAEEYGKKREKDNKKKNRRETQREEGVEVEWRDDKSIEDLGKNRRDRTRTEDEIESKERAEKKKRLKRGR